MKFFRIIDSSGWFSKKWGALLSYGGLLIAVLPWFLNISTGYCIASTIIGSTISLIGSYEGKAKQFGFQAPFTNDPLGWRKAKESYRQFEGEEDEQDKGRD